MANFQRRRPRDRTRSGYSTRALRTRFPSNGHHAWMDWWPRWWDVTFHTRPRRRRTRVAIVQVLQGRDPDAIVWPVEKKPHIYYW